jgi:hypothetical protein
LGDSHIGLRCVRPGPHACYANRRRPTGDSLDGILCPFDLQVADPAEEFADARALGEDLGVSRLERVFGELRDVVR